MEYLSLHCNGLSGVIPEELGLMAKLHTLILSNNTFSGERETAGCVRGKPTTLSTFSR